MGGREESGVTLIREEGEGREDRRERGEDERDFK
jgi:hypothetical protein